jgi:hypothetical protein
VAGFYRDLGHALWLIARCRLLDQHGWGCMDGIDHAWRT